VTRIILFYFGLLLMALSLLWPLAPFPPSDRWNRAWMFDLGLLLAVAAHGWPGGL
jgi:hypothetical protein